MAVDLSSVLLIDDDGNPITPSGGGDAPGDGIYSITVQSYNGSFIKCFTIRVDRSPTSSYPIPDGYRLVSTATSISNGGVHIVENYIPQMLLDIDTQILLLDSSINPTEGSASGVEFRVLTEKERADLYSGMNDVVQTFSKLMDAAGVGSGNISGNVGSTKCLKQMSFAFEVTNLQQIDGMLSKRITPAVFMQIVYAGFGLALVQTELNSWTLTDTITMISSGDTKAVSIENIASLRTSYDYKKMAKSTHITMNGEGQIVTSRIDGGDVHESIDRKSYRDSMLTQRTAWAGQSIATGADVELSAPAMPLLRFASYKGIVINKKDNTVVQELEGDCFPEGKITAKVSPIEKEEGFFRRSSPGTTEKKYDISALSVKAKGEFAKFMHKLMTFRNKLESAQLSTTFEGVILPAFSRFEIEGGQGSLQKVVISPTETTRVVESANVEVIGFIMSSTIVRSSGRIVSIISYANMKDEFPLVFK